MRLFGTDGIRGEVGKYPLTAENVLKLAKAASIVLRKKNSISRVVINKDTRLSNYMFEPALASGFISMGIDVILVGPLPTPALTILSKSLRADFSVMITASHNPYQDNGLKFFSSSGYKITAEEEKKIEDCFFNYDFDNTKLKVVLDCANGAAYKVAPEVLFEIGTELETLGDKPNGVNINEKCGSLFPQRTSNLVKKRKSDIGICLDGDGDRLIIIDEKGEPILGEELLFILAKFYLKNKIIKKGSTIVTNEIANFGLDISLKNIGLKLKRVKVGDKNILNEIQSNGHYFGGEPSGHFIFKEDALIGDGMSTALRVLTIILKENKKLSELKKGLNLLKVVEINQKIDREKFFQNEAKIYRDLNFLLKSKNLFFVIRPSGTEPLLRVNLQYQPRNIKVTALRKLEKNIIEIIANAC